MEIVRNNNGTATVEFILTFVLFITFVYGLLIVGMYGIGSIFVQEAAHVATQEYAVSMDYSEAEHAAKNILQKWAYPFVDVYTANIQIWQKGDNVSSFISACPKIRKLYVFTMPDIVKTSSCVLEYRFRHPEEFNW